MTDMFKISKDTILTLVSTIIDRKISACKISEDYLETTKYIYKMPGLNVKETDDDKECTYTLLFKDKIVMTKYVHKPCYPTLNISTPNIEIRISAEIDPDYGTTFNVPFKFWSTRKLLPYRYSVSILEESYKVKYNLSFNTGQNDYTRYDIDAKQYSTIISKYRTVLADAIESETQTKVFMMHKSNAEALGELLDLYKIEKKIE